MPITGVRSVMYTEAVSYLLSDDHSAAEFVGQVDASDGFCFPGQAVEEAQEITWVPPVFIQIAIVTSAVESSGPASRR